MATWIASRTKLSRHILPCFGYCAVSQPVISGRFFIPTITGWNAATEKRKNSGASNRSSQCFGLRFRVRVPGSLSLSLLEALLDSGRAEELVWCGFLSPSRAAKGPFRRPCYYAACSAAVGNAAGGVRTRPQMAWLLANDPPPTGRSSSLHHSKIWFVDWSLNCNAPLVVTIASPTLMKV